MVTNKILLQHIEQLDEKIEAVIETLITLTNKFNQLENDDKKYIEKMDREN